MKLPAIIRKTSGFTLIELLIVIALLGALAVGLIGALDPFEQLKKGTDTGTRDIVNQVQTAVIRYYSIKNNMPWCPEGPSGTFCTDPDEADLETAPMGPVNAADPGNGDTALDKMIAAGELKEDFATIQENKLDEVFVTGSYLNNTVSACYRPTSKSFRADPNTKFDITGALIADITTCEGNGGAVLCYWCIQ